jgi:predicted MPP superfamily phosphohydrolase
VTDGLRARRFLARIKNTIEWPMRIMIFLAVYFLLTCLSHAALYRFTLRLFAVTHPGARWLLLAAFSLLAVSFMAAFFLLRWQENALTIDFYRVAAVWVALSVNLLLAVGATWLCYGVLRLLGVAGPGFRVLAGGFAVAALAFSLYGFWSAFNPRITQLEVSLPRLPENWHHKTIVQISDVHLGHFHGPAAMHRLAETVNALDPDMVVITGDLFDGMMDGLEEYVEPLKGLRARRGVFMVSGNHEVYAGLRRCLDIVARSGIRVLANERVDVEGLCIIGVSYPGIEREEEIKGLETPPASPSGEAPCILLFHTPTDVRIDGTRDRRSATYWRPDTTFALSRKLGVSLQLSGHTHKGQMVPFGILTRWIYGGLDYGRHRFGDFTLYTSSGVGTWGPPMRTGARPEIVRITLN